MGRMYTASFNSKAQAVTGDLMDIASAGAAVTIIHSFFYGQHTDAGDAQAEMMRISISRYGTTGSAGQSVTAQPLDPGDAAFSGTVKRSLITNAATTLTVLVEETANVQAGWFWKPIPEERIVLGGGDGIVVRLETTPADSITTEMTAVFEEIG